MTLAYFVDRAGVLGQLERTPQGGYRAPANFSKVGIMEYDTAALRRQGMAVPDDFDRPTVRVYTPAAVLQAAKDSMCGAPVTREHPPEMINTDNYSKYTRGTVGDGVEFDGVHLSGKVALQDAVLLTDVQKNVRREVSAGYMARTAFEPGVTADGAEYDAIREEITYNHLAVVKRGRAGASVCLALDSTTIPTDEEIVTIKLKIKGAEVAADAAQAVIDSVEGSLAAAESELTKLRAELDETKGKLAVATSDAAIDAAVTARDAKVAAEKTKADKLKAFQDAFPDITEPQSEAFMDGALAALKKKVAAEDAADPDGLKKLRGKAGNSQPNTDDARTAPKLSARQRMVLAQRGIKV